MRGTFFLSVLISLIIAATLTAAEPVPDMDHAEAMRLWLADQNSIQKETGDPWIEYLGLEHAAPARREAGLRRLLDSKPPESLKRVLLLDLQSDLEFKSAQAQFIRRYGFYSNWFNRAFYVASRAVQGNVTAAGQLVVDGVFDFAGRGKATSAERRLYKLLDEMRAEGRTTRQDRERMRELRGKIERAQAAVDLERAEWALRQGQPELARYYAQGTANGEVLRGGARIVRQAEAEIARRTRGSIASAQAGYPDREPPIDLNSPELMRAAMNGTIVHHAANALLIPDDTNGPKQILVTSSTQPYTGKLPENTEAQTIRTENFVLAWMLTTMDSADHDPISAMRRWARVIEHMGVDPRRTAWVKASLDDPSFNPELRLLQAQSARRAGLARFIFLGPQTGRERAYIASSRLAQTWNAVASIGVFYVFEVFYRAGIAALKPPAPADEIFDAQASFLRAAPGNKDAGLIASQLADQYILAGRPDNAEAVLAEFGGAGARQESKIARSRAGQALDRAERLPLESEARTKLIERALTLAPNSRLAKRAERMKTAKPPREDAVKVKATWKTLAEWVGTPSPSGLPGDPLWFDGDRTNGEIEHPWFSLESEGVNPQEAAVIYYVRKGDKIEIVSEKVEMDQFANETRRWITLAIEQQARMDRESRQLGRTLIPYEFTGGAGLSGVDFYPRLLPIEPEPGESRLYEDL